MRPYSIPIAGVAVLPRNPQKLLHQAAAHDDRNKDATQLPIMALDGKLLGAEEWYRCLKLLQYSISEFTNFLECFFYQKFLNEFLPEQFHPTLQLD
jgi:hypothetical protein